MAADEEQALADSEQTSSDEDQTVADLDQEAADADQRASDRDQVTADHEQASGSGHRVSYEAYAETRQQRAVVTEQRAATATLRNENASQRSAQAAQRDRAARLRDALAEARDHETQVLEDQIERLRTSAGTEDERDRAAALAQLVATSRERAAADRARAAADRQRAAEDRKRAAQDRKQARIDLEQAYLDELTGAQTRRFGLAAMAHHVKRANRLGEPLTLAFIDIDRLKAINDRDGHAAGDEVLRAIGRQLKAALRTYDPVVRLGGDEFLCALTQTGLQAAEPRIAQIKQALPPGVSISVGLAELRPGESLNEITARGDRELYEAKALTRRDG